MGFAHRTDPFSGEGAFHKGVDITAPTGTTVRTTADGIVVQAEMVAGGYGRLVIVDHGGGLQTYYAHLSKISVHAGQELHRGDVVGQVGSSGRTTAPHLHYEVHVGGAPVNPYRYLANATVFRTVPKDLPVLVARTLLRCPSVTPAVPTEPLFRGTLICVKMRTLVLFAALTACACGPATQAGGIPEYTYEIVHTYPHDPMAFTQGLLYLRTAYSTKAPAWRSSRPSAR